MPSSRRSTPGQGVPADVAFRRVPVWFREVPSGPSKRLFYTLEALGLVPTLHRKVFQAIHGERTRLRTPRTWRRSRSRTASTRSQFMTTYNSFGVQTKAQQARQTAGLQDRRRAGDGRPGPLLHQRHLANAGLPPGPSDRHAGCRRRARRQVRQGPGLDPQSLRHRARCRRGVIHASARGSGGIEWPARFMPLCGIVARRATALFPLAALRSFAVALSGRASPGRAPAQAEKADRFKPLNVEADLPGKIDLLNQLWSSTATSWSPRAR